MKNRVISAASLILAILLSSCTAQEPAYRSGEKLGQIYLSPESGAMSVMVSLDGLWRVSTESSWIRLDGNGGNGRGAFTFRYGENKSDIISSKTARRASIIIQRVREQVADTLRIIQQGAPDGRDYSSSVLDNYIEFIIPELKTVKLLYANLAQPQAGKTKAWLEAGKFDWVAAYDPDNVLDGMYAGAAREGHLVIGMTDTTPTETISGKDYLAAAAESWNLVVANFPFEAEPLDQYYRMKELLDSGYNRPLSGDLWIIGGTLNHLSVMEAGYPETPEWYPTDPSGVDFMADRYAWESNLYDSVFLTHKSYNPSFTADGRSWRPDYAYVSSSAWNHLVSVDEVPVSESGLQHAAYVLTLKY